MPRISRVRICVSFSPLATCRDPRSYTSDARDPEIQDNLAALDSKNHIFKQEMSDFSSDKLSKF